MDKSSPKVFFAHSNGFSSKCYSYLFELLNPISFEYVDILGLAKTAEALTMHTLAEEYIAFIESKDETSIIGLGHSLGGAILYLAAAKRPDLFKKLILIEPILFGPFKRIPIAFFNAIGLGDALGPAKKAIHRKTEFDSRNHAKNYLSEKAFFNNFNTRCFEDYIKFGFKPKEKKVTLSIPAAIELAVFRSTLTKIPPVSNNIEKVFIYGNRSDTIWPSDVKYWRQKIQNAVIKEWNGTHMFPLEQPVKTAQLLRDYIF